MTKIKTLDNKKQYSKKELQEMAKKWVLHLLFNEELPAYDKYGVYTGFDYSNQLDDFGDENDSYYNVIQFIGWFFDLREDVDKMLRDYDEGKIENWRNPCKDWKYETSENGKLVKVLKTPDKNDQTKLKGDKECEHEWMDCEDNFGKHWIQCRKCNLIQTKEGEN